MKYITTLVISLGLFIGCENNPVDTPASDNGDSYALAKGKGKGNTGSKDFKTPDGKKDEFKSFPKYGEVELEYFKKARGFGSGKIQLDDGSKFKVDSLATTAPKGHKKNTNLTLTMLVEKIDGELIFTFGPHGCEFSPRAEIALDYSALGVKVPTLYYIRDDGTYEEQTPDHVDTKGRKMYIRVDHFSRYAMAYGW